MKTHTFEYPVVQIVFDGHVKSAVSKHPCVCFAGNEIAPRQQKTTIAFLRFGAVDWSEEMRKVIAEDFSRFGKVLTVVYCPFGVEVINTL